MRYVFMLFIAFAMAIISSLLTAFGMSDLFSGVGKLILTMFVVIDLGRFLLFNFLVDEWNNLRKVKYCIVVILCLLFVYSGIGIFSKMSSLVSTQVEEAMINITSMSKATQNASIKRERSEDLAKIAQEEYKNALSWNETDYQNCIKRAKGNANSENNCNNTKRRLDKNALTVLQTALKEADDNLSGIEETMLQESKNKSHVSTVLMTVCKMSQKTCNNYDDLQFALAVIIFLVIVGTDYLQIAIVLAVNTRKNKRIEKKKENENVTKPQEIRDFNVSYEQKPLYFKYEPQPIELKLPELVVKEEKIEKKIEQPKPVEIQKEIKPEPKPEVKIEPKQQPKPEPKKVDPTPHRKFTFR